jgi:hypothetical protein
MNMLTKDCSDSPDTAPVAESQAHAPRRKRVQGARPMQELASEFGLSERQLYRLRRRKIDAEPEHNAMSCSFRISARLLSELGHGDLLATEVQAYLAVFIAEFVVTLGEHARDASAPLDPRWAKGNARNAIDQLRAASLRRQEKLRMIMENE